jgi:putative sigma-54 modulation protein
MMININKRNCSLTSDEEKYIKAKLAKIDKFTEKLERTDVIIKMQKYLYEIEVIVKALYKTFVIKKKGEHIKEIIDIIVDKMECQLTKQKEKIKNHHPRIKQQKQEASNIKYNIVFKNYKDLSIMSHEKAISYLDSKGKNFVVYQDLNTNKLCIAVKNNKYEVIIIE